MEQILSLVVTDTCPLSVDELSVLATANVRLYLMQWPRSSILWDDVWGEGEKTLEYLSKLTDRLHGRGKHPAMVSDHGAWAEEDRCRAAWAIAVVLSGVCWGDLGRKLESGERFAQQLLNLMNHLSRALVKRAPWASMSTAAAILQLVPGAQHGGLNGVGIGNLLAELLEHTTTKSLALQAVSLAVAEGRDWLGLLSTSAVNTIISLVQSRCLDTLDTVHALQAIENLSENSSPEDCRLKVVIPDVVNLLQNANLCIRDAALFALWSLVKAGHGDDFAIETCRHGGVPTLIELGRNQGTTFLVLGCLERLSQVASIRPVAIQHGILPLLRHSLVGLNLPGDELQQHFILQALLSYTRHLPEAVDQEVVSRAVVLRRLRSMAHRGVEEAHLLLHMLGR
eukprot:Skav215681  [mRNA]  locus=scaffold278:179450:180640:- [translate_table: standard]